MISVVIKKLSRDGLRPIPKYGSKPFSLPFHNLLENFGAIDSILFEPVLKPSIHGPAILSVASEQHTVHSVASSTENSIYMYYQVGQYHQPLS